MHKIFLAKSRTNQKKLQGFTLVEILLYIGLIAALVVSISVFLGILLQSQIKNQAIAEVEEGGIQILHLMTQTIRNAENINSPSQGNSATSLTLNVINGSKNPTVFDLSGSTIRIKEGVGLPVDLSSNRVNVSGLNFTNLTQAGTSGIVRVQFTLTHLNPESQNEYEYSKTFTASAGLRQ